MKILTISLFIVYFSSSICGQNLIGLNDNEIKKYFKDYQKEFNLQKDNNTSFRYLKYTDYAETQTNLFFLSDKYVCTKIRIICDGILKSQKIRELDSLYKKESNNTWTEIKDNIIYIIELKDDKWYFSIDIRLKE
jgi:hypothetical protein